MRASSVMNSSKKWCYLWALCLLPLGFAHAGDERAQVLLGKMCSAMVDSSYRGTLVYLRDNKLDSISIIKRKKGSDNIEKMQTLTGKPRAVIRHNDVVMCLLPERQTLNLPAVNPRSLAIGVPQDMAKITAVYHLKLEGKARIAGRDSRVLLLAPKDQYRYGYRLWIDTKRHLLLKNDLLGADGKPLEQLMFTDVTIDNNLPDSLFAEDENWQPLAKPKDHPNPPPLHWRLQQMPAGFALINHDVQQNAEHQGVEHLFLSDGMSAVSVYIKPDNKGESLQGHVNMGAINAFGAVRAGHKIVAVGAVPKATVELINQNIVPIDHAN